MDRPLDQTVLTAAVLAGVVASAWAVTATAPEAMDLGPASTTFRVADGIEYDHSGQYTAVGSFDYTGE